MGGRHRYVTSRGAHGGGVPFFRDVQFEPKFVHVVFDSYLGMGLVLWGSEQRTSRATDDVGCTVVVKACSDAGNCLFLGVLPISWFGHDHSGFNFSAPQVDGGRKIPRE